MKKAILVMSHGGHTKQMQILARHLHMAGIVTCYLVLREDLFNQGNQGNQERRLDNE